MPETAELLHPFDAPHNSYLQISLNLDAKMANLLLKADIE
jgi:hypothetical protein